MVDEAHVERRVVNDQFGPIDEGPKIVGNLGKYRLVGYFGIIDAVDGHHLGIDMTLGVDVLVVGAPGEPPIDHLDGANLYQTVAILGVDTCRFSIQNYLAHGVLLL